MAQSRREKLVEVVREMFALRERTAEGDQLNAEGIPFRITNLAEKVFAPETKFNVPGKGPQAFSGGLEGYFGYHAKRIQKTSDKLDLELLDILASDTRAAALVRYTDEASGEPFEWLRVNVFTFNEAGDKVIEVHTLEHDQYGVDAFFSRSYAEA